METKLHLSLNVRSKNSAIFYYRFEVVYLSSILIFKEYL